ncbi:MAG: TonB family protein [Bacteroidota bacterium]
MKKLLTLAFILATTLLFAQSENDKKVFLDSLNRETTETNQVYYRIIKDYNLNRDSYLVKTHYKSGKLKNESIITDKTAPYKTIGTSTEFFESGQKKSEFNPNTDKNDISTQISWFENGNLESEIKTNEKTKIGTETNYYEDGTIQSIWEFDYSNYNNERNRKIIQFWDKNKKHLVKDGNGIYLLERKNVKIKGTVKNYYKDGDWTEEYFQSHSIIIEKYDNGNFIIGKRKESDGSEIEYTEIEKQPSPRKGYQDFYKYIGSSFKYSDEAVKNKVNGRIFIEFVIEKDGKIIDVKLVRGLGYGLDEEAIRVISNYENWIPGQQKGKNVRVRYSVPIMISLK